MVFKAFGVRVKIEFSFLLMLAFSLVAENEALFYLLLFSALHEAGHLCCLLLFGKNPDCLTVAFYGIGLKHSARLRLWQELVFLLGGIAVNAFFIALNVQKEINLALFLINALPLYPLDGGRIIKLVLNRLFALSISDAVFKAISAVLIAVLVALSIIYKNISLALISAYIIVYSLNNSFD